MYYFLQLEVGGELGICVCVSVFVAFFSELYVYVLGLQMICLRVEVATWSKRRNWDWIRFQGDIQNHKRHHPSQRMRIKKSRYEKEGMKQLISLYFLWNMQFIYLFIFCWIVWTVWKGKARWCPLWFKRSTGRVEGYGCRYGIRNREVCFVYSSWSRAKSSFLFLIRIGNHNSNPNCRQNKSLNGLQDDVDELNSRVRGANQRARRLLGK